MKKKKSGRKIKPISINPEKEKDLYNFLEEHGTKKAVVKLFDFYTINKDLMQNILDKLENLNLPSKTKIQPKIISKDFVIDDDADDMLMSFIK